MWKRVKTTIDVGPNRNLSHHHLLGALFGLFIKLFVELVESCCFFFSPLSLFFFFRYYVCLRFPFLFFFSFYKQKKKKQQHFATSKKKNYQDEEDTHSGRADNDDASWPWATSTGLKTELSSQGRHLSRPIIMLLTYSRACHYHLLLLTLVGSLTSTLTTFQAQNNG